MSDEDSDTQLPIYHSEVAKSITVEDISDSFDDAPAVTPRIPSGMSNSAKALQRRQSSHSTQREQPFQELREPLQALTQVEEQSQILSEEVFKRAPESAQNKPVQRLARTTRCENKNDFEQFTPKLQKTNIRIDDLDDDEILPAQPIKAQLWHSQIPSSRGAEDDEYEYKRSTITTSEKILPKHFPNSPDQEYESNESKDNITDAFEAKTRLSTSVLRRTSPYAHAERLQREEADSNEPIERQYEKQNIMFDEPLIQLTNNSTSSVSSKPPTVPISRKAYVPPAESCLKDRQGVTSPSTLESKGEAKDSMIELPAPRKPKIDNSVRQYTKNELSELITDLDLKKDWTVQFKTLQKIQNISQNQPELLISNFDALMQEIHSLLKCLRSAVFKEAIITLSIFYAEFTELKQTILSQYMEISLFQTLQKAGSASQADFLAESADLCLKNINLYIKMLIQMNVLPKPIIETLQMLNRSILDKSPGVRARSAFLASDLLEFMQNQLEYGNEFSVQIAKAVHQMYVQILAKVTQDSNQECRKGGRRLYFYFKMVCQKCGLSFSTAHFRGVEDVIQKEGVSRMWFGGE